MYYKSMGVIENGGTNATNLENKDNKFYKTGYSKNDTRKNSQRHLFWSTTILVQIENEKIEASRKEILPLLLRKIRKCLMTTIWGCRRRCEGEAGNEWLNAPSFI